MQRGVSLSKFGNENAAVLHRRIFLPERVNINACNPGYSAWQTISRCVPHAYRTGD